MNWGTSKDMIMDLTEAYDSTTHELYKLDYSQTSVKQPLRNRQNQDLLYDKWLLNEGRKYCRMFPLEHSAILLTCIKR